MWRQPRTNADHLGNPDSGQANFIGLKPFGQPATVTNPVEERGGGGRTALTTYPAIRVLGDAG